jgi:hypothetical protein
LGGVSSLTKGFAVSPRFNFLTPFSNFLPTKTDPAIYGEGWKSILEHKPGEIPAARRIPESGGGEL